jgi:hypothetical protein
MIPITVIEPFTSSTNHSFLVFAKFHCALVFFATFAMKISLRQCVNDITEHKFTSQWRCWRCRLVLAEYSSVLEHSPPHLLDFWPICIYNQSQLLVFTLALKYSMHQTWLEDSLHMFSQLNNLSHPLPNHHTVDRNLGICGKDEYHCIVKLLKLCSSSKNRLYTPIHQKRVEVKQKYIQGTQFISSIH